MAKIGLIMNYIKHGKLSVEKELLEFVNKELLPGISIDPKNFWSGFDKAVHELFPINKKLISIRSEIQKKIDDWHIKNKGKQLDIKKIRKFFKGDRVFSKRRFKIFHRN